MLAAFQSEFFLVVHSVLNLMLQGKSNLAIKNHYTTQDLRLTLEQVEYFALGYHQPA
jgi:hypothetical protein